MLNHLVRAARARANIVRTTICQNHADLSATYISANIEIGTVVSTRSMVVECYKVYNLYTSEPVFGFNQLDS